MKRVVITGLGAITPIGNNLEEYNEGLKKGQSGAGPITRFDASNYKTKFALIQLEAFYIRNLIQYPATGRYFIYDLENSADVEGDFSIDGNFYGLSLNISPKKGWLKKKKTN